MNLNLNLENQKCRSGSGSQLVQTRTGPGPEARKHFTIVTSLNRYCSYQKPTCFCGEHPAVFTLARVYPKSTLLLEFPCVILFIVARLSLANHLSLPPVLLTQLGLVERTSTPSPHQQNASALADASVHLSDFSPLLHRPRRTK